MKVKMINILIVDSNQSTSQTFRKILKKRGYAVDLAENSKRALEMIKNNRYDVALISLENTDINGNDILFFAKKNLPYAAKLIATGFPSINESIGALESGADAVFAKPVPPEQIITVIEKISRKNKNIQVKLPKKSCS